MYYLTYYYPCPFRGIRTFMSAKEAVNEGIMSWVRYDKEDRDDGRPNFGMAIHSFIAIHNPTDFSFSVIHNCQSEDIEYEAFRIHLQNGLMLPVDLHYPIAGYMGRLQAYYQHYKLNPMCTFDLGFNLAKKTPIFFSQESVLDLPERFKELMILIISISNAYDLKIDWSQRIKNIPWNIALIQAIDDIACDCLKQTVIETLYGVIHEHAVTTHQIDVGKVMAAYTKVVKEVIQSLAPPTNRQ